MPTKRALKVFVAMAFGRDDTDALYNTALRPLLTRPGDLRPIRVDRSNRNEPIDEQIYRFMDQSELCVADLTYARPSVYYEAGWMRGKEKAVIFTCRADHLDRRKPAELADQLRVHFDVEQESIVVWKSPTDRAFRRRLQARLSTVLRPLLKRRDADARRREEEAHFARLSPSKRCQALAAVGESCLRAGGLRNVVRNGSMVLATRGAGKAASGIRLFVQPTFSKEDLGWRCWCNDRLRGFFDGKLIAAGCAELTIVSLSGIRRTTVERVFSNFDVTADSATFTRPRDRETSFEPRVVHIVDNVKSERELRERLATKLGGRRNKGT